MYLIFLIPMSVLVLSVFNVGIVVSEKMKLQNAADAAAYSAGVWEARYANLAAYANRAMVANYDTIATEVALWSMADARDGFTAAARSRLRLTDAGKDLDALHGFFHRWNQAFATRSVGRSGSDAQGATDLGGAGRLESYTTVLSYAQAALYLATQIGREFVVRDIARAADPQIDASIWSEGENALSLHSRVSWRGTDEKSGIRQVIERSLNDLARGGSFRDTLDLTARPAAPYLDANCGPVKVTARGFDAPGFDRETGEAAGEGGEDQEGRVEIVRNDEIYQRDHVASARIDQNPIGCPVFDRRQIQLAHDSDDQFNVANPEVRAMRHEQDGRWPYHQSFFEQNALPCGEDRETGETKPCATVYRWARPLADVRVTTYVQEPRVADGKRIEGPTVLVTLRKKADRLPVFRGLGLTDPYDLEAYSFAKVYYAQRRDGAAEKESLFNPFWAARLESFRPSGAPLLH